VIGFVVGAGIGNVIVAAAIAAGDLGPALVFFGASYCCCAAVILSLVFINTDPKEALNGTYGVLRMATNDRVASVIVMMIPFGWSAGALFIARNTVASISPPAATIGGPVLVMVCSLAVCFSRKAVQIFNTSTSVLELSRFILIIISILVALCDTAAGKPDLPQTTEPAKSYSIIAAVLMSVFAMAGFESTLSMAPDSKEPRRDIPRAMMLVAGIACVLYTAVTWSTSTLFGTEGTTRLTGTTVIPALSKQALKLPSTIALILQVVSLANGVTTGVSYSTNLMEGLVMVGRLPPVFGRTKRNFSPAAVLVGIVACILSQVSYASSVSDLTAIMSMILYGTVSTICARIYFRKPGKEAFYCGLAVLTGCLSLSLIIYAFVDVPELALTALVILALCVLLTWRKWPEQEAVVDQAATQNPILTEEVSMYHAF
jgi:amino acid transporter